METQNNFLREGRETNVFKQGTRARRLPLIAATTCALTILLSMGGSYLSPEPKYAEKAGIRTCINEKERLLYMLPALGSLALTVGLGIYGLDRRD